MGRLKLLQLLLSPKMIEPVDFYIHWLFWLICDVEYVLSKLTVRNHAHRTTRIGVIPFDLTATVISSPSVVIYRNVSRLTYAA